MKTKTYFKDSDKQARSGTDRIVQWLRNDNYWVTNLEKVACFQGDDIDLYVHRQDVGALWIELKIDSYSSGNLFLEIIGNDNTGTEGCIYATKSSHVYYCFESSGEVYVLPTLQLQQWLRKNEKRFRRIKVPTTDARGVHWYNSVGVLTPKDVVLQEVPGSYKLFLPAVFKDLQ